VNSKFTVLKKNLIFNSLFLVFFLPDPGGASPLDQGNPFFLGQGTKPFSVLDKADNLHLVFLNSDEKVSYWKIAPSGIKLESLTIADQGDNPRMTIDVNGGLHFVWDRYNESFYRAFKNGEMGLKIALPKHRSNRHWMPSVAVGSDGTPFWAYWGIDGGDKSNSSYFGYINTNDQAVDIYSGGANRPPNLLGPNGRNSGDGKVYAFKGSKSLTREILTTSGAGETKTFSIAGKTLEGRFPVWAGTEIMMAVNTSLSGTDNFAIQIGKLSSGKSNLVVAKPAPETSFPRGAWDEKNKLFYFHYWNKNDLILMVWNPETGKLSEPLNLGPVSSGGRGTGAGAISYTGNGGVWVVRSTGGLLTRQSIGDYSGLGNTKIRPAFFPAAKKERFSIFPNPFSTQASIIWRGTGAGKLVLFNSAGRRMKRFGDRKTRSLSLSGAALPSGVYWLGVENLPEIPAQKIVIRH